MVKPIQWHLKVSGKIQPWPGKINAPTLVQNREPKVFSGSRGVVLG